MKQKIQKFREYLDYIEEHYDNVQKAWVLIQERCKGGDFKFLYDDFYFNTIDTNIKEHDMSKLSKEEFTQYRRSFYPCDYEVNPDKYSFDKAWEHHKSMNQHHWEHWTRESRICNHKEIALVENICDWVAMGFKFGDTAKDYYEKNKANIDLPDWAEKYMYEIFDRIY